MHKIIIGGTLNVLNCIGYSGTAAESVRTPALIESADRLADRHTIRPLWVNSLHLGQRKRERNKKVNEQINNKQVLSQHINNK